MDSGPRDNENAEDDDPELTWVRLAERGANELKAMQLTAAGKSWREAFVVAEGFADDDPRRAASLNNLGVLARVQENAAEADQLYCDALLAWDEAHRWVAGMQLAPRARSSLFHLRMELRHRHHYARLALDEHYALLSAARAITQHNRADERPYTQERLPSQYVVRMPALDEPFLVQAEREGWIIDRPAEFTDEGRLMASRMCTCLLMLSTDRL